MRLTWFIAALAGMVLPFGVSPAVAEDTPSFPAQWVLPPTGNVMIGGAGDGSVFLAANAELLQRVVLKPTDLHHASLTIQVSAPPRGMADAVAEGKAANKDVISLDQLNGLHSLHLSAGTKLAITVWRSQFHYDGSAALRGLRIERLSDHQAISLPIFDKSATATTPLGTLSLTAFTRRSRFPLMDKEGSAAAGDKPGVWSVTNAKNVRFTSTADALDFFTQGQSDFSAQFDAAPVLVFEPQTDGDYAISGTLNFKSGPASDKTDPRTMRWMVMTFGGKPVKPQPATLAIYRALKSISPDQTPVAGKDFDAQPVATAPIPALAAGRRHVATFDNLATLANDWLHHPESAVGLIVKLTPADNANAPLPRMELAANTIKAEIAVEHYPAVDLFANPIQPREHVFAHLQNGHLYYGDQRLRLWGTIGYPDVGRIKRMGFNAQRVWNPSAANIYDTASAKKGEFKPAVRGDGSPLDLADKHFAELKQNGMFVMFAPLTQTIPAKLVATDDSFIAGGSDWEQWKQAVLVKKPDELHWVFVDPRLQKLRKQHARNLLTHVNFYTGKPYGQDECIAVYEIFNENGGAKWLLEGSYRNWPAYFRNELQAKWNQWLAQHYKDDAALQQAWGKLSAGESLSKNSVELGPTLDQRNDFPKARAADFVHFVTDLIVGFEDDFRSYCRSLAPAGVGVNVAPFSFDTQYRPNLSWSFVQSHGEVNCPGMYFWDIESTLTQPPSMYVMDSNTIDGCATVIYETNAGRPGRYRAEYAMKVAALASWQDWDGVFWHYWGPSGGAIDEAYITTPMLYANLSHYWDAVHHEVDPVMCTTMAMAGRIFLGNELHPAPDPAIIKISPHTVYGYDAYNGFGLTRQTFTTGARLKYQTQGDAPPPVSPNTRVTDAVATGDQILWDWPNGRLIIDSPYVHAYAGAVQGPYRFKDGIVIGDFKSKFMSFWIVSADGKPLVGHDAAKRIYVAAVADAQNSGFETNWSVGGSPLDQARAIRNRGHAPVQETAVPYSIWFPTLLNGKWTEYDFALRAAVDRPITGNQCTSDGLNKFVAVLTIDSRGAEAATPTVVATTQLAGGEKGADSSVQHNRRKVDTRWNPVPNLAWSDDYAQAHKIIRDATFVYTSVSKLETDLAHATSIMITDAQLPVLNSSPADVEIEFKDGVMATISATMKQPPPFEAAVAILQKQLGAPAHTTLGKQYETSQADWPATDQRPAVTLSESQGTMIVRCVSGEK